MDDRFWRQKRSAASHHRSSRSFEERVADLPFRKDFARYSISASGFGSTQMWGCSWCRLADASRIGRVWAANRTTQCATN